MPDLRPPRRSLGICLRVTDDPGQGAGLREGEDPPRPGLRVVAVGEVGLRAAGLEDERQPSVAGQRLEPYRGRQPRGVQGGLPLHSRQRGALRLRFDQTDGPLVHVEEVVDPAVALPHDHFTDDHALAGEEIGFGAVLHDPASIVKLPVDQNPGPLLRLKSTIVTFAPHSP